MPTATEARDAVVVETPRRRVDVTGADRLRYLEDVTSQALLDASPGTATAALVLDAHGAPAAAFDVAVLADRVALLCPDDEVGSYAVDVLGQRTFLLDARFTATDDVVVEVRGDGAHAVADAANLHARPNTLRPAGSEVTVIGVVGGIDLVGPRGAVDEAVAALTAAGARPGTIEDREAWRVTAGVPAWGREITSPHLPEEAGVLASHVHLSKGCYPGQEAVARMWMLGRPRRRLATLVPRGDATLAVGWRAGEGRKAAEVTSVTPDGRRALGYVPAATGEGEVLTGADGVEVVVERVIGVEDAPPGHDPEVTRRRDRARG